MNEVVIVSAKRTPIGQFNGKLRDITAKDLAKIVIKDLIDETKLNPKEIDQIIAGNVDQSSDAPNLGRIAALELGLPTEISSYTVAQNCASGLQAFINGVQAIKAGDSEVSLVIGAESMSQIPYIVRGARNGFKMRHQQLTDKLWEMLHDPVENMMMGETAEVVAEEEFITREQQDLYAISSYEKAQKANKDGVFAKEIVPVQVEGRRGEVYTIEEDELAGAGITYERLSKLKPAFKKEGTVTPGNSCGMNDGAAGLLLMSKEKAELLGYKPLAKVLSYASVGVDPKRMGLGPVHAVPKALEKTNLTIDDIDLFELNEAFAVQTLACISRLGIDREKVNPFGGAIALGHPVGATGARLLVTLLNGLKDLNKQYGIATLCVGGGLGGAVVIERM
ncbi:thiolase family protein [Bacillus sp. FJAT-45350]|uniref:thiolase family protein n=1 Tax=Bacillus sp. FJAT-45350 TaxID=2011014 RepID=UPI000BB95A1C|nr:thiolase family protein [Bacillus sp. FJAT-45350]